MSVNKNIFRSNRFFWLALLVIPCVLASWRFTLPLMILDKAKKVAAVPEWLNEDRQSSFGNSYQWISPTTIAISANDPNDDLIYWLQKTDGSRKGMSQEVGSSIFNQSDDQSKNISSDGSKLASIESSMYHE